MFAIGGLLLWIVEGHVFPQKELLVVWHVKVVHSLLDVLTGHDRIVVHRLEQLRVFPRKVQVQLRAVLSHELFALLVLDLPRIHGCLVGQCRVPHSDKHWVHESRPGPFFTIISAVSVAWELFTAAFSHAVGRSTT